MKKICAVACTLAAGLLSAGSAGAAPIFDNGAPNQQELAYADTSYLYSIAADDFTLTAGNNTIGAVNWWGACTLNGGHCSGPGSFTLYFYNNSAGAPGSLITSISVGNANQTLTGISIQNAYDEYSYSAIIPNLTLTAGTQYWLGISNTTSGEQWGWEDSHIIGNSHSLCPSCNSGWTLSVLELAFNLEGPTSTVPEPVTLSLFGVGIAGAFAARRRKPKA